MDTKTYNELHTRTASELIGMLGELEQQHRALIGMSVSSLTYRELVEIKRLAFVTNAIKAELDSRTSMATV